MRTVLYVVTDTAPPAKITDALLGLGGAFTRTQALAALVSLPLPVLGTIQPIRYWQAYLAKGYVQEVSRHE